MLTSLLFAMVGGNVWIVSDIPDNPGNAILDALMCIVSILFIAEIVILCVVDFRGYFSSFFFWMDILGTVTMIFEISFLLGPAGSIRTDNGNNSSNVNTALIRTARATKIGARVGRLSKLVKHLTVMFNMNHVPPESVLHEDGVEAKRLSGTLMHQLSTKVSLLTIVLVVIVPLFSLGAYPTEDYSMRAWGRSLEWNYMLSYNNVTASPSSTTSPLFQNAVDQMRDFFGSFQYVPIKLSGFPEQVTLPAGTVSYIPGQSSVSGASLRRAQNLFQQFVGTCRVTRPGCSDQTAASISFDFRVPNQDQAAREIGVISFILVLMVLVSFELTRTLDALVVRPLERMLGTVKTISADLFQQFGLDSTEEDGHSEGPNSRESLFAETELVENLFKKFARLARIATQQNVATEEQLACMSSDERAVMMDVLHIQVDRAVRKSSSHESASSLSNKEDEDNMIETVPLQGHLASMRTGETTVAALPVARTTVDSWDLDTLSLDLAELTQVAAFIFFDSKLGAVAGKAHCSVDAFHRFIGVVQTGYNDQPYHNYAHACDVLHTVYRLLVLTRGREWLSQTDVFALLVSALCHDIGHQGKTNPFLVETKHELALRYNDKSPLENMHCAKLFEICQTDATNIFKRLDVDAQRQARKVCIAAILHTDNVNHFDMVKEISKVYEMCLELCEVQAKSAELLPMYVEQILMKNSLLWMELMLHFADVSNPLKPFDICKAWAWRVLDEFFAQGDEEKKLGLPVGMLNDRDKINRPGSQHGFINFMVSPLVVSTVRLFPPLHPLAAQMASNLESWKILWIEDAKPSAEDIGRRDADISKAKATADELRLRSF